MNLRNIAGTLCSVLALCGVSLLTVSRTSLAQEQTGFKNIVVVEGLVHVAFDAAKIIVAISITTEHGGTIAVKLDDVSKGLATIDGRRVWASGRLHDHVFSLQLWYICNSR